nr:bifunctional nuclease family protein [Propionibacterium sp.]
MEVAQLAVDTQNQPVLLLRPVRDDPRRGRLLPIWIGVQEATAILLAVDGSVPPRPMSYDLMVRLLEALDASVRQVAVTRLEEGTFFAEITLDTPAGARVIDARPSDSIALAVRAKAPIFVADDVFEAAAMAAEEQPARGTEDAEDEVARFSRFLETVDPDDFRG